MCGVAGAVHLAGEPLPHLQGILQLMNELQAHRGPDGAGIWQHPRRHVGLGHRRLSIIDRAGGGQPMTDPAGNWLSFNGEIYNYREIRQQLGAEQFQTQSDTEVILHAYRKWGRDCVHHFRGMFAFALWDEARQELFCARDPFGIKPLYHATSGPVFFFASEVKALLPFLDTIDTDLAGLADYLTFQFCLEGKTLFKGVHELRPGHTLTVSRGGARAQQYWQAHYKLDGDHSEEFFRERLAEHVEESVRLHQRSDVPVGGYLSGGLDSTIVACLAARKPGFEGFVGKFAIGEKFDESRHARAVAAEHGFPLHEVDIAPADFIADIRKVIYHLDYPVAGPGSFPQYVVSRLAATRRKVVLGGQGADEIFGGYARYLIACLEQRLKAGTRRDGASLLPSLSTLREYRPLLQEFWREGLFDAPDARYFRLINRAHTLGTEVRGDALRGYSAHDTFQRVFHASGVEGGSYFDRMTHFDFRTLLPALLHVEDRVGMAHGLESRVPFVDAPLVAFAATIPSAVKFKNGVGKHILRAAARGRIPQVVLDRKDKMGFPVPLSEWLRGEVGDFVRAVLSCRQARERDVIDNRAVVAGLDQEPQYGRKLWGLLSLELWQQEFHDRAADFRARAKPQGMARPLAG